MPDETTSRRGHAVVCGDTPLALRLVEELATRYDLSVTALTRAETPAFAERLGGLAGVAVIRAERLDAAAFTAAGLAQADALALVDQEDAGNVDAALLAQELNPSVRIVIRMFNLSLGERMSALLNDCVVLSAAAIAAPAFVAAALNDTTRAPIAVADRTLVAARRDAVAPGDVLCGLAVTEGRSEPETLPADDARADFVLARATARPPRPVRRDRPGIRLVPVLVGARLRLVLLAFLAIYIAGTALLAWIKGLAWTQAAYIALLTEVGGTDADPNARGLEKIILVVLTLVSIALIPALTAAIVDSVVKARLRLESGGLTQPVDDHVIVVGLGDVGTRVVRGLCEAGVEVVAIERNPQARGVQAAKDLRIPVIIGDASRPEVLRSASVGTCRALVIVSTDDVTNLETALLGRADKADLRVVLRLFDGEFADRVRRAFNIQHSRSVSYLAAPAFAAAMLGRQVVATIPVRRRVLLIADLPVGADSALEHQSVATLNREHEVRLLAVRPGGGDQIVWRPSDGRPLRRSDRVVVVATRAGLGELVGDLATQRAGDTPYRLLEPWQMPQSRPDRVHESGELPPNGPADAPPTRRA